MNNPNDIRRRSFIVSLALIIVPACGPAPEIASDATSTTTAGGTELPVLVTLPPFVLTDQLGQPFGTAQLAGKPWVGNFIFTRCAATCPSQTANLRDLQERLEKLPGGANVQLISITVDPDHDTPDVLAAYADQAGADSANWHFLTGTREEVWELCKTGFKLAVADAPPEANTLILHSDRFILVDPEGRIRGFFTGTTEEGCAATYAGLQQLLELESRL